MLSRPLKFNRSSPHVLIPPCARRYAVPPLKGAHESRMRGKSEDGTDLADGQLRDRKQFARDGAAHLIANGFEIRAFGGECPAQCAGMISKGGRGAFHARIFKQQLRPDDTLHTPCHATLRLRARFKLFSYSVTRGWTEMRHRPINVARAENDAGLALVEEHWAIEI